MCEYEKELERFELVALQGHRVGKVPLLPATCYIEMARSLVIAQHRAEQFTLSDVSFSSILFLDDDVRGDRPIIRVALDRTHQGRTQCTAHTVHLPSVHC